MSMCTHRVHMYGHAHVRSKVPTHAGILPARKTQSERESCTRTQQQCAGMHAPARIRQAATRWVLFGLFSSLFPNFPRIPTARDFYKFNMYLKCKIKREILLKLEVQGRSTYMEIWIRREDFFNIYLIIFYYFIKFQ